MGNKRGSGDWDLVGVVLVVCMFLAVCTQSCEVTKQRAIDGCYKAGGTPIMNGTDFASCRK